MVRSAASEVHLESDTPNSMDRQEGIGDGFTEASKPEPRADLLADYAEQVGDGERESEMVKDESMTHDMRPPPEIAAEQDRETFDAKWQAEQQSARDDLLADYAEQDYDRDPSREQDRDLSL